MSVCWMDWRVTAPPTTRSKMGDVVGGSAEAAEGAKPRTAALLPVARRAAKRCTLARGSFSGCRVVKAESLLAVVLSSDVVL